MHCRPAHSNTAHAPSVPQNLTTGRYPTLVPVSPSGARGKGCQLELPVTQAGRCDQVSFGHRGPSGWQVNIQSLYRFFWFFFPLEVSDKV